MRTYRQDDSTRDRDLVNRPGPAPAPGAPAPAPTNDKPVKPAKPKNPKPKKATP